MKRSVVSLVALVAVSSLWACGGSPGAPAPLGTAADGGTASNVEGPGNPGESEADGGVVTPGVPRSDAGRDGSADGGEAPEPPPPPTKPNEIAEQFGVFVSTSGQSGAPGTRTAPLATIAAAIVRAKAENKAKVFVCEGSYAEALEVADGVSIEGRIDCSTPTWTLDPSKHVDVVAPSSPALRATNIVTPTRIDGLYVSSPDAAVSSESSIAFVVTDSNALTFANGRITAGAGAKGDDGVEGETLTMNVAPDAEPRILASPCVRLDANLRQFDCASGDLSNRPRSPRREGARATCRGMDGRIVASTAGGEGGTGGLYDRARRADSWTEYYPPTQGLAGTGTGADGTSGMSGSAGMLTATGYTPGNGTNGTSGAFGMGGNGGAGIGPSFFEVAAQPYWGIQGGGGGAGGCQGMAGTAGKGGGASIAVLSVRSALGLEKTQVVSGVGGIGGTGTFGSAPLEGSLVQESQTLPTAAQHGKRGGFAGISGHGASGPSFGIVHTGGSPTLVQTQVTPGAGGAGIPEGRLTMFGVDRVIPASADGESAASKAF